MTLVTRTIAGRTVTASCEPPRAPLAEDVLTTLERIASSDPLRDGMRVRFGWSMLTLREDAGGALTVCEPDFDGDPLLEIRPVIDTTLQVTARQVAFARGVGITAADASFDEYVVTSRGALASPRLRLERRPPEADDDSGWVASAEGSDPPDDPDALDAVRSYRLLSVRPAALGVLVAPTGFLVILDGDQLISVIDSRGERLFHGRTGL